MDEPSVIDMDLDQLPVMETGPVPSDRPTWLVLVLAVIVVLFVGMGLGYGLGSQPAKTAVGGTPVPTSQPAWTPTPIAGPMTWSWAEGLLPDSFHGTIATKTSELIVNPAPPSAQRQFAEQLGKACGLEPYRVAWAEAAFRATAENPAIKIELFYIPGCSASTMLGAYGVKSPGAPIRLGGKDVFYERPGYLGPQWLYARPSWMTVVGCFVGYDGCGPFEGEETGQDPSVAEILATLP